MRHAHIFGAKGVYLIPSANREKLDNNSRDCYFLSVLPNGDGVKVLDAETQKTVKTRDVFFDESTSPPTPNSNRPSPSSTDLAAPWLYPENPDPPVQQPGPREVEQHPITQTRQRPRRERLVPDRY